MAEKSIQIPILNPADRPDDNNFSLHAYIDGDGNLGFFYLSQIHAVENGNDVGRVARVGMGVCVWIDYWLPHKDEAFHFSGEITFIGQVLRGNEPRWAIRLDDCHPNLELDYIQRIEVRYESSQ